MNPEKIMKKFKSSVTIIAVIIVGVIIVALLGGLYWGNYLERESPSIKSNNDFLVIGKQKKLEIIFADQKSGLSQIAVEIIQNNKGQILATENIPARGSKQKTISLTIDPAALKLQDGPAVIKFTAADHSFLKNETVLSSPVTIDTVPPQIYLLNPVNHINQGGTCFLAFRTSKPTAQNGVYVNDYFTPGYTILIDNKPTSVAYFALPIDATKTNTTIKVFARDTAGNESNIAVPCLIKEKKFRADKVNLSEAFLQQKMPEFQAMVPSLQGKTPLEIFNHVNGQMRDDNFRTIQTICRKSSPNKLWEGTFLRMPKGQPMALFGDRRTYMAGGNAVGNSLHLGVDLASTAHAVIEAANDGIVVFTGVLGIYGNTVVIDHGQGLFSLYGHLSTINTAAGKAVKKQEAIGHSGISGLAGGDHLHFSILAGGQFVNPQEWWDPHWIKDNVTIKMAQ
ncbi:MAG: peptidase M23 [Deltaproteobacteria bacterium HGW-Deltaproteobacteria-12]|jgi:murein DD-endopeptidase MepM/ murein hydrolase activator NlpD|nr:MAG: peptidase M23 [Deltaproteobacteria bacterium HGW-Deltaproteobacteria-12]